jgi:hypothetical protein
MRYDDYTPKLKVEEIVLDFLGPPPELDIVDLLPFRFVPSLKGRGFPTAVHALKEPVRCGGPCGFRLSGGASSSSAGSNTGACVDAYS